jgi:hypothetical protein
MQQAHSEPIMDWSLTSLIEKMIKMTPKLSATTVISLSIWWKSHSNTAWFA